MRGGFEAPGVVDRSLFEAELDALRERKEAHTRKGAAIAAVRRRLPMVEVDGTAALVGERSGVTLFGVSALLFAMSVALTVLWCNSMSAMGGMPMPGGWTMSMAWMRMPGQTWAGATASFVGMWAVMMAAMMMPSLASMLWHDRRAVSSRGETRLARRTLLMGLGYFCVWTLFGLAVFPMGVAAAAIEMEQPALARVVPIGAGFIVLIAGALQFTKWKAHHLAFCREASGNGCAKPDHAGSAWKVGLHFGFQCGLSCANLTAILLAVGVMDLRGMAAITAAITAERLAPAGARVTPAIGVVVVVAGLFLIARATGLR